MNKKWIPTLAHLFSKECGILMIKCGIPLLTEIDFGEKSPSLGFSIYTDYCFFSGNMVCERSDSPVDLFSCPRCYAWWKLGREDYRKVKTYVELNLPGSNMPSILILLSITVSGWQNTFSGICWRRTSTEWDTNANMKVRARWQWMCRQKRPHPPTPELEPHFDKTWNCYLPGWSLSAVS